MDAESLSQRLRAARTLRGLTVEQLARRLSIPGLGAKTLGAIERGERSLRPHELRVVAETLETPESFFTAVDPFEAASPASADLAGQVKYIVQQVDAQIAWGRNAVHSREQLQAEILDRVSQLERLARRHADALEALAETGGAEAPEPGGELGRDVGAGPPTARPEQRPATRPARDVRQGNG